LHLHGLPDDVVVKTITDFVEEQYAPERPIHNYADWLYATFGRTFAESFPMQYTRKYHTTAAENLSTDWLGPRIYRPNLEEVLRGALSNSAAHKHYITHFRYPSEGGFMCYLRKFVPMGNLRLRHEVVAIDPRERTLECSNGVLSEYDQLISSIPLPDLVPMIRGTPPEVLDAAGRLACSSCVLVNLGVDRQDLSTAHMTYFYDEDICFSRLGFPHMLSPRNAPPGTGSIQAEVYFSDKYKPFKGSPEDYIPLVVNDLRTCGLLRDDDRILSEQAMFLRYANVIFDFERLKSLEIVHGYLDEIGISYCGRYGDWGYMWTDESFISGEKAAGCLL
jgi:protoporphyrinogen oxidase